MLTNSQTTDDAGTPEDRSNACWRKADLPELMPSTTAEAALTEIILGCVEHMRGNEECVLSRGHEEGIHQMRVAARRLRSCLALYSRFIPGEQLSYITAELKWLIGELGPARDWDVFVAEVFGPVAKQVEAEERLTELSDRIEQLRDEAYRPAQAAVGSQRYLGLTLLMNSWAEGRGWRDPANGGESSEEMRGKASDIAHELLDERYQQLLSAGSGFEELDAEQRHKVRIQLKKLRYATEFFSSLYPEHKVKPYLAAMKELQDDLGASNDVQVARKLLKRVLKQVGGKRRARLSYAAGLIVGWHSHTGDGREQDLIRAWQAFAAQPAYWETPAGAGAEAESAEQLPDQIAMTGDEGNGAPAPSAQVAGDVLHAGSDADEVPAPKPPSRRRVARSPQQG
jgi:CHAD domain-containing protein